MKILIIGGTRFLGHHLISAALERNHEITLFNRGLTSNENSPNVEIVHGDRNFDLGKLAGREFDCVIDTCGYLPESVRISAEALKDRIDNYIFISSISAYADFSKPNFDESAPIAKLTKEQEARFAEIDLRSSPMAYDLGEMYGPLKVLCEEEAEKAMPGRACIVRPGLIVGKYDNTDRFTYWLDRVAKGGKVLAPGNPDRFIQFIEAKDLAEWIILMAEQKTAGIFNATGKPDEMSMGGLLEEIKSASKSDALFHWASEAFLKLENIEPWSEMPLYIAESDESEKGFLRANIDKALEKGIKFRRLRDTILDILEWRKSFNTDLKAGISAEREKELLRRWHEVELR
jgi:2'-hydroxyisoflavone reductase